MARNIELKARLADLESARAAAVALQTAPGMVEYQVDTYFACPNGRLKLREIDDREARLVFYRRASSTAAKSSDYLLLPVADFRGLKEILAAAVGVIAVVRKRREIYFYENVRIHLDEVDGLGRFVEFEAVLGDGVGEEIGRRQVDFLREKFLLDDDALLSGSYGEMLGAESSGRAT